MRGRRAHLEVSPTTSTPTAGVAQNVSVSGMEPIANTATLTISGVSASPSGDWGTVSTDGVTAVITGPVTSSGYGLGSTNITVSVSPDGTGHFQLVLDDAAAQAVIVTDPR